MSLACEWSLVVMLVELGDQLILSCGRSTNFELADQLMPAQASSSTQSLTQPTSLAHPRDVDDVNNDVDDDVDD